MKYIKRMFTMENLFQLERSFYNKNLNLKILKLFHFTHYQKVFLENVD